MKFFFGGYTYLNSQLPSANKLFLITHFFFTSTHSLLLLQFIFLYFYLDFISSTCLPPLSLISFQISKKLVLSPYLWMVITQAPLRLEEHRHCRDHEEKWKAKQKRDQDTREMHQIVKFVEKLSQVSEKLQRNLCTICSV